MSFILVFIFLFITIIYSAITGSIKIGFFEFISGLFEGNNEKITVIYDLRFPRIIIALFAGACLAVSGALLQSVMKNPLADAGIIGISSSASFVSACIVTFIPTLFYWSNFFAFLGGAFACFLVFVLSWKSGLRPLKLILVGIAINAIFTGLRDTLVTMNSSLGSSVTSKLTMKTWEDVEQIVLFGGVGLLLAMMLFSWCNVLSLQDKTVRNLGVRINLLRIIIAAVAVLLASISTVVAGVISFVGLLIPHIGRRLVGSDYKYLLPFSALSGALLILVADTVGRTIIAPMEIPASTIMAIIGGPFLIFLLRRE